MIVKICGLTNLEDALCAVDAGADMLGFIFYPPSPRAVAAPVAADIVRAVRAHARAVHCVGVFVNERAADMLAVLHAVGLDYIQLSGDEPVETLSALSGRAYKAVRRADAAGNYARVMLRDDPACPDILLEADHPTLYGGTGQRADLSLAAQLSMRSRVLLAGGLTPDNVADAARAARPWGVDVASGVEAAKGRKDHAKVRAFVRAAQSS